MSRTIFLVLSVVFLAASGCGPKSPKRLSLIWISLDTLRADHLGLFGYERETSPFLDSLARKGQYFSWVVSPQNSTLPTHLTMFTGHHPVVHGIMHWRTDENMRLQESVDTLPQVLSRAGYSTAAWTDGGQMSGHFGYAAGFEIYQDVASPFPEKCEAALAALKRRDSDQPFFYLLHTDEMHSPYQPVAPYDVKFPVGPRAAIPKHQMAQYDGSIRFVDDTLRGFIGSLEKEGLLDETIVVITADHGDSFHEYGIAHSGHQKKNLHQNITRVPWIMLHPREEYRGLGEVKRTVGLIDFPNTMLALLGREERVGSAGIDLFDASDSKPRDYVSWSGPEAWSLYSGPYHLLRAADGSPQRNTVYDIVADPFEREAIEDDELSARLNRRLDELIGVLETERDELQSDIKETAPLPKDVRKRLVDLGHIAPSPADKTTEPD